MGWLRDLFETYENNTSKIGVIEKGRGDQEFTLLPVSHTTQNAQIEVVVDKEGNFYSAKVVDKQDATTIIPCTEASISRGNSAVPRPLHDNLFYVAGDFVEFGGDPKSSSLHIAYMEQLGKWCHSKHSHPRIEAIYKYLLKSTMTKDLVKSKVLLLDERNQLINKWTKREKDLYGEKPLIFKVLSGTQDKVFIRFDVHTIKKVHTKIWKDESIYNSFIAFYKENLRENDICYVTSKDNPKTNKHTSNIRYQGDKTKLISANDKSGYTYRGRFRDSNSVANISYDVSQKAHNALKWLILKQGKVIDGRVFLVWGNTEPTVPSPEDDLLSFIQEEIGLHDTNEIGQNGDATHEVFAEAFNKAIAGYKTDLSYKSKVMILILDAATPGRLSVMYYRNIDKEEYLNRIKSWHDTCNWLHEYKKDENKKVLRFYGAPATKDIAMAAYGTHASDKIVKGLMERMLPCVVDGQRIPLDIVRSAVHRASNPVSMEDWEWRKTLSITCALLKKHYEMEEYAVPLDVNNRNRDYLFGRLLALADVLEKRALAADEKRATNAIRYMNAFSKHPARTWQIIQTNLQPYQAKLGDKVLYYNRIIDEVASQMDIEDFNNRPLSGVYLLGFYSQRHDLYRSKKGKENETLQTN
ncbi:CRISPR-associated Csd1 family protein [Scopulibacillus darangshiensis]|uniref:CRISPR-associated Csd1 family protein n=1 Tax=Scopulibacillus darangshiensis TaxID=442528 RepID=A0A4R2P4P0_9BACL|nr:type I-C CRISPR-associated protein Cas8c/Csd1 [Scopulibacillus darangshiensis]TCP29034.1 CRISPR-associated Csd1 family protein [Scopulibacillus darangshiensis]